MSEDCRHFTLSFVLGMLCVCSWGRELEGSWTDGCSPRMSRVLTELPLDAGVGAEQTLRSP